MTQMTHQRLGGWLDPLEQPVLLWLAARLPAWLKPNDLTAIGFGGAVVTFSGYVLTPYWPGALFLSSVGYVINWFGDSLDGTVARHRGVTRNKFGYFLDNGLDMFSQFLVSIGIGLSGVINWELCFLAFSILLMTSSLAYIRAAVSPVHKMAYAGVGLTEMRFVGIGLNTLIFFVPPQTFGVLPMTYPNMLFLFYSVVTFLIFAVSFIGQLRELAKEDPPRP